MEDIHRRIIQRNYKTLVEQTNIYSLIPKLLEKKVFSKEMIETYTNSNMSEMDRKRELFDDVERRGPHAWVNLLDSLRETGHVYLYELLKNDPALQNMPVKRNTMSRTTRRRSTAADSDSDSEYVVTPNMKSPSEMTEEELEEVLTVTSTKENYMRFKQVICRRPKKNKSALEITEFVPADRSAALAAAASTEPIMNEKPLVRSTGEPHQSETALPFRLPYENLPAYQNFPKTYMTKNVEENEPSGTSSISSGMQLRTSTAAVAEPSSSTEHNIVDKFMNLSLEPMKVVVKSSTRFYDDINESKVPKYRMRGKRRGVLLLINNMKFVNDCEPFRAGAHVDEKNMTDLFEQMGFEVCRYRDLTLAQMRDVIKNFSSPQNELLRGLDSVFVTVMSHGYSRKSLSETSVVTSDGHFLSTEWIVEQFNNNNCPIMDEKPKVFFFQACRGENVPQFLDRVTVDGKSSNMPKRPPPDILIAYCTIPGYQSHRDTELGAWYIQIVCDVFMNHAHDTHIEDLLKMVNYRMSNLQTSYGTMQSSMFENRGFKHCFLHPNFYASGVQPPIVGSNVSANVPYSGGSAVSSAAHSSKLS